MPVDLLASYLSRAPRKAPPRTNTKRSNPTVRELCNLKRAQLTEKHNVNRLTEEVVLAEYTDLFRGLGLMEGKLLFEVHELNQWQCHPGVSQWQ